MSVRFFLCPGAGRLFWTCIGGLLALIGAHQTLAAQTFSNLVFFGDSNTDSGHYRYIPQFVGGPTYTTGIFTTSPGLMWSVALAQKFGVAVTPSSAPGGGNNYAAGNAHVLFNDPTQNAWSATMQVANYLASTGGKADSNTLYTLYIGTNDLKTTTTDGLGNIVSPTSASGLQTLAQQTVNIAISLKNAGARYLLVPNILSSPLTQAASIAAGIPWDPVAAQSFKTYSQDLWGTLAANNVNFIPADFATISAYVLEHPASFGITVTSILTPACGSVYSFNCTSADWVAPNADKTYFFADSFGHVASGVQKIQADYVYNLLMAPGQISLLPVAEIRSRLSVIDAIRAQMPDRQAAAGERHVWISGDVARLKNGDLLDAPMVGSLRPVSIVTGADYQISGQWFVGASAAFTRAQQSFGVAGGSFRQDNVALSLYAGFRDDGIWANSVLTEGVINTSTGRLATLGITTEDNRAKVKGTGASMSLQAGYDFTTALADTPLVHGPLGALTLQSVRLGEFSETNAQSGFTALHYNGQTRGSSVVGIGYQGSLDFGDWRAVGKLVWNHELRDGEQTISATLPSTPAPAYLMPAASLPRNWTTASIAAKYKLNSNVTGFIAGGAQFGAQRSNGFSATAGINLAL